MDIERYCTPCRQWFIRYVSESDKCSFCGTTFSRMITDETEEHKHEAYEQSKGGSDDL
jgi:rRNA maturation endonuclease Nob1